jgi:hypothetical protein
MDPDPGGPKIYRSCGSGSGSRSATLLFTPYYCLTGLLLFIVKQDSRKEGSVEEEAGCWKPTRKSPAKVEKNLS